MTNVVKAPASLLGTVSRAFQGVQLLDGAIGDSNNLPQPILAIRQELQDLRSILLQLDSAVKVNGFKLALGEEVRFVLENCERVCIKFKPTIGALRQTQLGTLKAQLNGCHGTISTALQASSYHSMASQDYMTKDMSNQILQQFEGVLENRLIEVNRERQALERHTNGLMAVSKNGVDMDELMKELHLQRKTIDAFRTTCEKALKSSVFKRTGQKITAIKATDNSVVLTGFINAKLEETRIDQEIFDVAANKRSVAVAGVVRDIDVNALVTQLRQSN